MRVLLAQNLRYLPSHGGASRADRLLIEGLAYRGHDCIAVAPLSGTEPRMSVPDLLGYLARRGIRPDDTGGEAVVFTSAGVQVHVVANPSALAGYTHRLATRTAPDWVLVPSDDPGLVMLGTALRACPGRVVYLAHTLQQVPLGPRSFYPAASRRGRRGMAGPGLRLLRRAAGIVAVSRTAQDRLREWGGLESTLIYPPVYGRGPFARLGRVDGAVTMVNPCGYKGLPIFLGLADARPDLRFLAVPTWGTSAADRDELSRRPNVEVVDPVDDLPSLLARTSVLLMPSLWDETFGYTAVEAALHGVPVLASDVDGVRESTFGAARLLPVNRITGYRRQAADEPFPQPIVPPQDVTAWLAALIELLGDADGYAETAERGRRAATAFVTGLDEQVMERYLATLRPIAADRFGDLSDPVDAVQRAAVPDDRPVLARLLPKRTGRWL